MAGAILLPSGNAASGGAYAVTLCAEGTKVEWQDPDMLTKHYTIGVQIAKFTQEELAGILNTGAQIVAGDPDFQLHKKDSRDTPREADAENYRLNISIVWMQKLDS